MEMKEVIKLWKEAEIDHAEFKFSCGGDSMGDTELIFYKENKQIKVDRALYDYFDNSVYENVEFYVNSFVDDYMGESGTVTIELDEEEDRFEYDKSSSETWLDYYSDTLKVEITKEQAQFLEEYVSDMSAGEDEEEQNYKKDFILTEEVEKMIEGLHQTFYDTTRKYAGMQGELLEGTEFYQTEASISEEDGKFFVELDIGCNVYSKFD